MGSHCQDSSTKVLLMCVERLSALARGLMEHGMSSDTPSAMISWGTYGRQRSVTAPLEALAKKAQEAGLSSPSIVVLGEVVQLRDQISWFEKPLLENGSSSLVQKVPLRSFPKDCWKWGQTF